MPGGVGRADSKSALTRLDLAAMVLLHLRSVLADCAVLAAPGLKESSDGEEECGQRSPNCTLRGGISKAAAF
jgi:hypothetical protein